MIQTLRLSLAKILRTHTESALLREDLFPDEKCVSDQEYPPARQGSEGAEVVLEGSVGDRALMAHSCPPEMAFLDEIDEL